jgi:hypothetical protein
MDNEEDEEPEVRNIGCQIVCRVDVAEEVAQMLRTAVDQILNDFSEEEIVDHGVD